MFAVRIHAMHPQASHGASAANELYTLVLFLVIKIFK